MKFGLLLPHFGKHASRKSLLDGARHAEAFGFDSVWVRDHLVFEPHGEMEDPNRSFYDALTTLTAIGAVTERITLGTGSLIPFRHPLVTALMAGTLTPPGGPPRSSRTGGCPGGSRSGPWPPGSSRCGSCPTRPAARCRPSR